MSTQFHKVDNFVDNFGNRRQLGLVPLKQVISSFKVHLKSYHLGVPVLIIKNLFPPKILFVLPVCEY